MGQGKAARSFREGYASFLAIVAEVALSYGSQGKPLSVGAVVEGVASRLGIPTSRVAAVVVGCEEVAAYGFSALALDSDALVEEREALAASRRALRPSFEARLQGHIDLVESVPVQPVCGHDGCGMAMGSKGQRSRCWESTLGEVEVHRRWSTCEQAGHPGGRSVAQERVLLPEGRYTARLSEAVTMLSTVVPYGMAAQLSGRLLGVKISEHALQDEVEDRASVLMALDEEEAQGLDPFEGNGLEREVPCPAPVPTKAPEVAYLEVDGVFAMTRRLDEARSAPIPDARGGKGRRYLLEGKEVKNAVLYTADACAQESASRGSLLEKRYVSALATWTSFALLLWVTMRKLRFDQAKVLVLLSDGALWIRELASWLPCSSRVTIILDLFHAIKRVYEVADAVFGDTPERRCWKHNQKQAIEEGCVQHVIDRLRLLRPRKKDAKKKVAELITYFENNQDRMQYPAYRRLGFRITSAAVESANFHVTGARLKAQGMRWDETGAAQMARMRADLFNETWEARTRQALAA